MNIAGYYQDDGNYSAFEHYLRRALPLSPYPELLRLRLALFLSPVSLNWQAMLFQRQQFANHVFHFCQTADKNFFDNRDSTFFEVDSSLDRIHFYLAYHGLNDRPLQEAVQCAYCAILPGCSFVAPNLRNDKEGESKLELVVKRQVESAKETPNPSPMNLSENSVRRIRIGFLSKFFGLFEPHGLLLDGVMNLLSRSHFHVLVLAVARNDAKPLHHTVSRAAKTMYVDVESTSNVVEVPLHLNLAARTITALNLDVLVFAGNFIYLCQVFSHLSFFPQTSYLPTHRFRSSPWNSQILCLSPWPTFWPPFVLPHYKWPFGVIPSLLVPPMLIFS